MIASPELLLPRRRRRAISDALSSAFLEWVLIALLFLSGLLFFLARKLADACKLRQPCPSCARLDRVFAAGRPTLQYELMCAQHRKEASSLALCRIHGEIAHVHAMCKSCFLSFADEARLPAEDCSCCGAPLTASIAGISSSSSAEERAPPPPAAAVEANVAAGEGEPKEPSSVDGAQVTSNGDRRVHGGRAAHEKIISTSTAPNAERPSSAPPIAVASPTAAAAVASLPKLPEIKTRRRVPKADPDALTYEDIDDAYKVAFRGKVSFFTPRFAGAADQHGSARAALPKSRLSRSQSFAPRVRQPAGDDDDLFWHISKTLAADAPVVDAGGGAVSKGVELLKRQVELDRKSISLLWRELEEERRSSAAAAKEAAASIARLQQEKAAVQTEALQYQRIMEEQAAYNGEAMEEMSRQLADKVRRIRQLEEHDGESFGLLADEAYVADGLARLERKLHLFSNNGAIVDSSSHLLHAGDGEVFRPGVIGRSPIGSTEAAAFQEEIAQLKGRLAALESDHHFLEHCLNSLRCGDEGLKLLRSIAGDLQQLRKLGISRSS